jgi:hypothetical protein
MGVMTDQPTLPFVSEPGRCPYPRRGQIEDTDGGRVCIRGNLVDAWRAGEDGMRRLAAVQLTLMKVATAVDIAAACRIENVTLWR